MVIPLQPFGFSPTNLTAENPADKIDTLGLSQTAIPNQVETIAFIPPDPRSSFTQALLRAIPRTTAEVSWWGAATSWLLKKLKITPLSGLPTLAKAIPIISIAANFFSNSSPLAAREDLILGGWKNIQNSGLNPQILLQNLTPRQRGELLAGAAVASAPDKQQNPSAAIIKERILWWTQQVWAGKVQQFLAEGSSSRSKPFTRHQGARALHPDDLEIDLKSLNPELQKQIEQVARELRVSPYWVATQLVRNGRLPNRPAENIYAIERQIEQNITNQTGRRRPPKESLSNFVLFFRRGQEIQEKHSQAQAKLAQLEEILYYMRWIAPALPNSNEPIRIQGYTLKELVSALKAQREVVNSLDRAYTQSGIRYNTRPMIH